jgi:hypothetical protein
MVVEIKKKKKNKRVEELMKKKRGAFSGDLLSIFTWQYLVRYFKETG